MPKPLRVDAARRVGSGDDGNSNDYVRDLIRKDQHGQRLNSLWALVEDGLASGPATPDTQADGDGLRAIASGKIM